MSVLIVAVWEKYTVTGCSTSDGESFFGCAYLYIFACFDKFILGQPQLNMIVYPYTDFYDKLFLFLRNYTPTSFSFSSSHYKVVGETKNGRYLFH